MSFYQYRDGNVSSDSSDSSDDSNDNDSLPESKFREHTEEYLLVSNSKDRNYKNGEQTFSYNILFGTNFSQNNIDNGKNSAYFTRNYENIKSITVEAVLIPNLYLDLDELHGLKKNITGFKVRLRKIRDLDYITMNVSGYQSNIDGTNNVVCAASNILIVDDSKERVNNSGDTNNTQSEHIVVGQGKNLVLGVDKGLVYMKNITDWSKDFINPVSSINNLKISFYDPSGRQLQLMNDYLTIQSVKRDASSKYIILTLTQYFSPEEYSIGDTLIIRELTVTGGGNSSLETFLNRTKGHNIFDLGGATADLMYNEIHIASDYSLSLSTGTLSNDLFSLSDSSATNVDSTSVALNLNNQNTIFFKLTRLTRRANFSSEII
jgi:hypothetical protein